MKKAGVSGTASFVLRTLVGALLWIGIWYLAATITDKPLIFPTPLAVLKRLLSVAKTVGFYSTVFGSLLRIFAGTAAGVLAGIVFGSLLGFTYRLRGLSETMMSPLLAVIRATPVASTIILMFYFFSRSSIPILISALMVTPIVTEGVTKGLREVGTDGNKIALYEMTEIFGFSRFRKLRYLYIPSVSPYFHAACRSAIGLSWKAGIAAEVICNIPGSIGNMLHDSKINIDTEGLFAWTTVTVILSVLLEKALISVGRGIARRKKHEN